MQKVFVLAQGRSGTAFLADLLGSDPRCRAGHEPWPLDPHILGLSRSGRFERAVDALLEERFASLLPAEGEFEVYAEVNSFLRYNVEWLRRRFDPFFLHVIRDGRAFVRSAWGRDLFTPHQQQLPIVPADDEPESARFAEMDRFERICWIWAHTNTLLGHHIERHARLEDLVSDYGVFRSALLEPTGIEVSEETWRRAQARPKNTSGQFRARRWLRRLAGQRRAPAPDPLPHWDEWPEPLRERFWRVCGSTMERFGYGRAGVGSPSSAEVGSGQV